MEPRAELDRLIRSLERGSLSCNEFVQAFFDRCTGRSPDLLPLGGEVLQALVRLRQGDVIGDVELWLAVLRYLWMFPNHQQEVLAALSSPTHDKVHELAPWFQAYCRCEEQSRDLDYLRRTSPLQPGTRLLLGGGYTGAYSPPWWLNGRESYSATFLGFAAAHVGSVPRVFVELDEEIDMTEAAGRRHKGQFAVLSAHRSCAFNQAPSALWGDAEHETLAVEIVEALPADVAALSACCFLNTAIESHAGYRVLHDDAARPAPLWWTSQEIARSIDALDDERTADMASHRLRALIDRAPALLLTALPALVSRLGRGGRLAATIRSLLLEWGTPALRALIANLSCQDSRLCGEIASAIGHFGPLATQALPELEKLLHADLPVRVPAALAIAKIDRRTTALVPIFLEGLAHPELGCQAANCLREMGPEAGPVVPALLEILNSDRDPLARAHAAVALGGMGLEAVPAIATLTQAMDDASEEVRGCALGALRELRALARTGELILECGDLSPLCWAPQKRR
jgi:hypothetical protein